MEYEQFDRRLARECAKAFSQSTGLGCTLSDKTGRAFDEYGYGCESCGLKSASNLNGNLNCSKELEHYAS